MEKKGVLVPMLFALGAAFFYMWALTSRESELRRNYEMVNVITAKVDVPERTVLKTDLVEAVPIPRKYVAQDAYEVKTQSDLKLITNLVTKTRIPKGNQVVQSALLPLSPEAGLSAKVPPGYRGTIVPVESDLMQLIKPGDRVDILVTFDALIGDNRKEKVTATILQNVLVLGVGQNLGQGISAKQMAAKSSQEHQMAAFAEKGVLSLALNPTEAQYLSLALKTGDTAVVIRGLGDMEMHPMEMSSFRRLFR